MDEVQRAAIGEIPDLGRDIGTIVAKVPWHIVIPLYGLGTRSMARHRLRRAQNARHTADGRDRRVVRVQRSFTPASAATGRRAP